MSRTNFKKISLRHLTRCDISDCFFRYHTLPFSGQGCSFVKAYTTGCKRFNGSLYKKPKFKHCRWGLASHVETSSRWKRAAVEAETFNKKSFPATLSAKIIKDLISLFLYWEKLLSVWDTPLRDLIERWGWFDLHSLKSLQGCQSILRLKFTDCSQVCREI